MKKVKTKRKQDSNKSDLEGIDPGQTKEEALRNLPDDDVFEEGSLAGPCLQSRRDARELVLKILYSHEITSDNWRDLVKFYIPENENRYYDFAVELIERIKDGWDEIDVLIVRKAEKWDFNRIAVIDKLILRMSIAEILFFPDIPPKVTINEAIEIAKIYSTNNSSRFVNGILDAVFNDFKSEPKKT